MDPQAQRPVSFFAMLTGSKSRKRALGKTRFSIATDGEVIQPLESSHGAKQVLHAAMKMITGKPPYDLTCRDGREHGERRWIRSCRARREECFD